jgi:hypothetical protein
MSDKKLSPEGAKQIFLSIGHLHVMVFIFLGHYTKAKLDKQS